MQLFFGLFLPDRAGIPPTPPRNFTALVRGQRVELRWNLPVRSPVKFFTYRIEYIHGKDWRRLDSVIEHANTTGAVVKKMDKGKHFLRLVACGTLACSEGSNVVTVTIPEDDDLVLPEALVGAIVGGILFLLVAILLALLAIFHSRKKDRKSKAKKYNDVTYGKPDEMNGRYHERPAKRDRWSEHYGGGDIVTSLSNTDSIFFTPKSRDLHNHQHLEQLQQQQQLPQQHSHHHHHHHHHQEQKQQQQLEEQENPHFYHYSQQQQQQRPKYVVGHGRSDIGRSGDDEDDGGDAGFAGPSGRNRKHEPPDKNFHTGQDAWDDQHRPQGLVPFTEERRSKKKSKKKKKKEATMESHMSPRAGHVDTSGGIINRPIVDPNRDGLESSFRSDFSQAGSFSSRPLNYGDGHPVGEDCYNPSSSYRDEKGSASVVGSINSHFPGDSLARARADPRLASGLDTSHSHLPDRRDDSPKKRQQLLTQTPHFSQIPPRQYNNNSLNESPGETVRPQHHMSLSSSSLRSHQPHPQNAYGHSSSEPHPSHLSHDFHQHQPHPHSSRDPAVGLTTSIHNPPSADSRHDRSSHHVPGSDPRVKFQNQENKAEGYDLREDTEDNVFWNPQQHRGGSGHSGQTHPGLPRHSSLKPGHKMTYLTDDDDFSQQGRNAVRFPQPQELFSLQDISSVLEPESELPSQVLAQNSQTFSPPSNGYGRSSDISGASTAKLRQHPAGVESYDDGNNTTVVKPLAMVTPSLQSPGENSNTSTLSSGRPLGYTRDRLQGVLQKLREAPHPARSRSEGRPQARSPQDLQPRSRSEGGDQRGSRAGHPHFPDYSARSDPFPQSRFEPKDSYGRGYTSNPQIPDLQSPSQMQDFNPRGSVVKSSAPQVGDIRRAASGVPSEKNVYVNLQNNSYQDRDRYGPKFLENFPKQDNNSFRQDENPYRNMPQRPLPSYPDMHQHLGHGEVEDLRRPRALSEGSRMFRERLATIDDLERNGFVNKGASYPDVSLPRPVRVAENKQEPNQSNQHFKPWYAAQDGIQQPQYNSLLPQQSSQFKPGGHQAPDGPGHVPLRYFDTSAQHPLGYQSSTSSGIGSRNTSQSTGSLQQSHPLLPVHSSQLAEPGASARLGIRARGPGRGGTSFSSGHTDDGDISLDTSSGGYNPTGVKVEQGRDSRSQNPVAYPSGLPRHRRDTSVDENYEFDSINALENDIMDDLRRYSRLAGSGNGSGVGTTTLPASNHHSARNIPQHHHNSGYPVPLQQQQQQKFPNYNNHHPPPHHHHQPQQMTNHPNNTEQRFERLREEFKAYRSQRGHSLPYGGTGSEDGSVDGLMHPPTAGSALPIGMDGEPLYPMDSEML
ncbi:protein turtle [Elysia marginata]|uniref:Protein turtle n=1 Tax=Elysia marginata TaxID=1093978 RepID=A0AAV4H2U5_9GAST|nr:protein turtle [Elysia marginata]